MPRLSSNSISSSRLFACLVLIITLGGSIARAAEGPQIKSGGIEAAQEEFFEAKFVRSSRTIASNATGRKSTRAGCGSM